MNEEQMKYVANLISQNIEKDKQIELINANAMVVYDCAVKCEKEIDRLNKALGSDKE